VSSSTMLSTCCAGTDRAVAGFTRTIENTREWLGDEDGEYADPRTRPAKVDFDEATGNVHVDMGSLADLFPAQEQPQPSTSASAEAGVEEGEGAQPMLVDEVALSAPKILITTSPGKPPAPFTRDFLKELQNLLGGERRADVVPRKSPKFELGRVARWAKQRGYGAIVVVGEDHAKPTQLTVSLLPAGPTAHFRLSSITLAKDIERHAKATSHPPELVLNHFHTPLGLSLASLLSRLFLPPDALETLRAQGYAGRQVVLAQNSRDFVFIRRYRYMFVLRSQKLGGAKMHARQERAGLEDAGMHKGTNEDEQDDTIKTRFQEIGPRLTIKMRWLRRGQLGETREERAKREAATASGADDDGTAYQEMDLDTGNDAREEREAAAEIGLDGDPNSGELNERLEQAAREQGVVPEAAEEDAPAPTERRRKRKLKSHPLLRPAHSPSPPPGIQEGEAVPKPQVNQRGKVKSGSEGTSLLSSVGKSWHPGKGEGGVRDAAKSREWEWQSRMGISRRKFFL